MVVPYIYNVRNGKEGNTMDSTTNVTPAWTQTRQTKLGTATITIRQEGDLVEADVTITYNDAIFKAEGIFSSEREAFLWAYGVKQTRNDRYAGYTAREHHLVETKPTKGKVADIISIGDALIESQQDYDNFILAKASKSSDKVSLSSLTSDSRLSDEDKAVMASLLAKLGKVTI